MQGIEWHQIKKGTIYKGKTVPTETWMAVEKKGKMIIGALARSPSDDRWMISFLSPRQERIVLFKPSALTVLEAKQVWENEYLLSYQGMPSPRDMAEMLRSRGSK